MTVYLVVPFLLVLAILQTGLIPHLTVWGVFPDLPVLVVASWGLLRGGRQGLIWGFIAGVPLDLLSAAPFGAATLALMAAGLLSGLGRATVFRAHVTLPLAAAFVATVVYDVLLLVMVQVSGQEVAWLDSLTRNVLRSGIVNAALALPVFWFMRWAWRRWAGEAIEW